MEIGESWAWCYLDDQLLPSAMETQPSTSPGNNTSGTGKQTRSP